MKSRRQIAFLLIFLALAAFSGYQTSFAQNYPVGGNHGYSQPNPVNATTAPYQQQQPVTGYANPTGNPAGTPTGTVPPNDNYMIDRPLGAVQNGVAPNGVQPDNPPMPQNARPIVPPPEGYSPPPEEVEYINVFLADWSRQSKTIEALDYEFTCRQYSNLGNSETYGRVKFRAPDKGLIEIDRELINGKISNETSKKMRIVCTGEAVYQFDYIDKKLTEFVIPQEQRGQGVLDSPLMILVGANPQELQERFYLMALKPWSNNVANCYCFKAWPKWPEDLKEFKAVQLAIDKQTFHAKELLVFDSGGDGGKAYEITKTQRNFVEKLTPGMLAKDDFDRNQILKSMPRGWMFETKNDFLPEASGRQYAQQPNPAPAQPYPQYTGPANVPNNAGGGFPAVQPNVMPQNQPNPNQTQLSQNGVPVANNYTQQGHQAPLHGQTGYAVAPQYTAPQTGNSYGANPQSNQYMAMPPQGSGVSQSVIR